MIETHPGHPRLFTPRLTLRPWADADARAALEIFGDPLVADWLSPVLPRIAHEATMLSVLQSWRRSAADVDPVGHWALVRSADDVLVGGLAIRDLETADGDLEIAWQLSRRAWGHGYAAEAGRALALWALGQLGTDELFALVRPRNQRSCATARRIGMEWVGETEKFHGLLLQVYRVRFADLVRPATVESDATRLLAEVEASL